MSYVRVSIQGTTAGGEKWSVNPVFDPSFEFGSTVDQGALDAAALAIANLTPGSDLINALSTAMLITAARVEVRDDATDNLLALSIQGRTTPQGGALAPKCPPQSAVVFSLRTNTPGGRGRGRLYWPGMGLTLESTGRILAAMPPLYAAQMATYLHAMESALATAFPTIGFDLAVRSTVSKTTPHVNRMQVGNVVDTQRRRRDTLAEAYVTVSI